eukprot:gene12674-2607_t
MWSDVRESKMLSAKEYQRTCPNLGYLRQERESDFWSLVVHFPKVLECCYPAEMRAVCNAESFTSFAEKVTEDMEESVPRNGCQHLFNEQKAIINQLEDEIAGSDTERTKENPGGYNLDMWIFMCKNELASFGLKGIQNVQFSNIVAKAEQGVVFAAFGKSAGLSNITLSNISLTVAAISDIPHNVSWQVPDSRAVHDYRPLSGPAAARETSEQPRAAVDGCRYSRAAAIGSHRSVTPLRPCAAELHFRVKLMN